MSSSEQQQLQKQQVAEAALAWVQPDWLLGVGTGSTVTCFIEALAASGVQIEAAVSSSEATTAHLKSDGIHVRELNHAGTLDVYIDGADEFDPHQRLIKGGGGALPVKKSSRQPVVSSSVLRMKANRCQFSEDSHCQSRSSQWHAAMLPANWLPWVANRNYVRIDHRQRQRHPRCP